MLVVVARMSSFGPPVRGSGVGWAPGDAGLAADARRVLGRADDEEVVVHHQRAVAARARGDELALVVGRVGEHHVGLAALPEGDGGA